MFLINFLSNSDATRSYRNCHDFCCREKSSVSHSITPRAILEVASVNIPGATAFETSGKFLGGFFFFLRRRRSC